MTNRRKRVYESIIVGLSIILMALCAYMGITAVQKSMRLNVSFSSTPNVVCCIGVKKTLETPSYTPIFDNKANQIAGGVRLSGNSLIFDDTRFSNSVLGGEYYLSFTNYSDTGSAIILTFSNANVNDVQPYQYIVESGGTVDGLAITQANSMTINMQKCVEVTLNTTGVELNTDYENTTLLEKTINEVMHYYQNSNQDLKIQLKSSSGHAEPPKIDSIEINGDSYENFTFDGNNILTIPASAINGDITINTSAVELLGVSLSGLSNCTSSNTNTQTAPNQPYSTTITPNANYKLPETITVKQGGVTLNTNQYSWDSTTGQLSIPSVTGNIEITCVAIISICTITFDWNNDVDGLAVTYNSTTPPTSTTYIPGNSVTLANPTKVGCEFLGWTYTGENVEPLEEPTLNLILPNTTTGDLEITANWGATLLEGVEYYVSSRDKSALFEILWSNFKQSGDPDLLYGNNANYNNGVALYEPGGEAPPYFSYSSTLTSITFGYWEDYASKFNYNYTSGIENLDEYREGSIQLFKYGTEAYILSPNKIFANQICNGLLAGEYTYAPYAVYCYMHDKLSSITFENFDTSIATDMSGLFYACSGLTSLDLSSFNTSNVIDMSYMFLSCSSLTKIYVGNSWSTANVSNSSYMFSGCISLVGGMGTTLSSTGGVDDKTYAQVDFPGNPGYLTYNDIT